MSYITICILFHAESNKTKPNQTKPILWTRLDIITNDFSGNKRTRKRQRQKDSEGGLDRDDRPDEGDVVGEEEGGGDEEVEEERIVGDVNSHISFTIETKDKSKTWKELVLDQNENQWRTDKLME